MQCAKTVQGIELTHAHSERHELRQDPSPVSSGIEVTLFQRPGQRALCLGELRADINGRRVRLGHKQCVSIASAVNTPAAFPQCPLVSQSSLLPVGLLQESGGRRVPPNMSTFDSSPPDSPLRFAGTRAG